MLKHKARLAFLWGGADILFRQGVTVVVTIVLARLLAPEVFGTVALLYLLAALAVVVVDGGFSAALIQSEQISHEDESTVFWFGLFVAALLAVIFCMAAPLIADFFAQPVLQPLVLLLSFNLVLSALGAVHTVLLSRALEFKVQMKVGVVASVLSGVIAVAMAWAGYGVWALAAQAIVATMVTTVLLWLSYAWRPALVFSPASLRRLFAFGGYLFLSNVLDVLYSRLGSLLVGKLNGVKELGHYTRAEGARDIPMGMLASIMASVAFPVFSVAAGDKVRLLKGVRFSVRLTMLLNIPMMLGIYVIARPLMLMLFGEQWLPAVRFLEVMCLASLLWPLHVLNQQVLKALGLSGVLFRVEVLKKAGGCLLLVAGSFWGALGIVWSMAVLSVLGFLVHAHYTGRYLGYGLVLQMKDVFPVILVALPMTVVVMFLEERVWALPVMVEVLLVSGLGVALFFGVALLVRLPHVGEAWAWLRFRSGREGMVGRTG